MKKFLLVPLAIILIATMCFSTACEEEGPAAGSHLRVAEATFAFEVFDPIQGESFFGWMMYDPIVTWDEDGNFVGAIAKDWTLSDDGLTWTFTIRDDVVFHNGDPLTSADVMFSVEHMQDPMSWNPWSHGIRYNMDTMYCPDDYTFVYKTVEPEPTLIMSFAATRVLPKDYFEEVGQDAFRQAPIGSGPWKFVSFESGNYCEWEANTEHWRTVPHFERLTEYVVPEESTRIAMLKRDEVDIIQGISHDRLVELEDEGWELEPLEVSTGFVMCFPGTWVTDGPTGDKRVRQAMAYSINYEEICDTYFHGRAEPGGRFFMYPGCWGWGDDWEAEPYDPALAASLLADAGYPDAFDDPVITIYVQTGTSWGPDLVQILQTYWTAAGIQTQIEMRDANEWAGMFFVPNTEPDAPNVGAVFPWGPWPNFYPSNVYHSGNMYTPGGAHSTSNDAHALELFNKAIREVDPDLAEQYWTEFQDYCHDEMFINFGVVLSYEALVLGPEVGDFGYGTWLSYWDSFADIAHK